MKLDIIGSVASGKTTLAKSLSETYHVPFYQKDNIVWERTLNGDKKRDDKARDQLFQEIINSEDWIVEGSPRKLLRESFEKCDYISFCWIYHSISGYQGQQDAGLGNGQEKKNIIQDLRLGFFGTT